MSFLLEVRDLVKHFSGVKAVNGVSFSIARGSCFGLLGPNGAGKTTTVEMLEGINKPDQGEIFYKGKSLGKEFRDEAGIMFQSTALQEFITVAETLELFSRLYPKQRSLDEIIEICFLDEFLDRDTRKLSGGQRQRLLLAIALINDPEILFLDEPTTGLDPQARHKFWHLIDNIKQQGKTIILTTHYMEEAYSLCDEIAIMDHGKIIAQGTPRALLAMHFNDVILQLPGTDGLKDVLAQLNLDVLQNKGVAEFRTGNVTRTLEMLLEHGVSLQGLQIREPTLEDLFLELTGKELRQ
ncbi:MAG TPA: ABC transporter ATP-binding protein [Gammaproteobacteria bacterium]